MKLSMMGAGGGLRDEMPLCASPLGQERERERERERESGAWRAGPASERDAYGEQTVEHCYNVRGTAWSLERASESSSLLGFLRSCAAVR